ncbi:imidazole glycerol phosphate synthase, glutamine amidotransferase subunit [Desulfocapsa sulfexigens DSM 10523]|uniref:Imidazole glycerol phosphate synthase subunit HisH n=1 Tax=Desulfocapsa sulfexigens (strain DSM 10523 / SB164P1) TaxID=1167006 RepID=M1NHB4_DESSD|nr:imidazole glycerol phosphate synthase subunit HisH [Desulfocapsa sulfexigens]AGF78989.1 imidazole glycerol phosphate synthase, glutamine amidotransferase subunit [Desulfocapsa sulfexigens DSM 10523]
MRTSVAIIDVGINNLLSVTSAFEFCGAKVSLVKNENDLLQAERLVLPGVGAFKDGMKKLEGEQLISGIKKISEEGKPLLGICLGMQMLFDSSLEFGLSPGLGLIPGKVVPIPPKDKSENNIRIPHIGWSSLYPCGDAGMWEETVFKKVKVGSFVYFVHSFMAVPEQGKHILAETQYCGHRIVAAVKKDNIFGCQFHPEKSGEVGLSIIDAFLQET